VLTTFLLVLEIMLLLKKRLWCFKLKKNIFEYENYREYLKDVYAFQKEIKKNFSFRHFSKLAGFKAGNILKLVMDGERNIAPYSIEKFAKGLKLNKEEAFFFKNLVLFNQATNSEERQFFAQELVKCRRFKKIYPLKESQFNYYRYWYFICIRELVDLPDFREDESWIAKRLTPQISPAEAREAVDELLTLGLIKRDGDGRLRQTDEHVSTSDEVTSASLAGFHRQMLKLAGESIDRIKRDRRDISGQTFCTSLETAKKIKEKIQNFRKEIIEVLDQERDTAVCVYHLSVQLFPVAEPEEATKT
jgi:uncharacterized protein (TIGR02147 family)